MVKRSRIFSFFCGILSLISNADWLYVNDCDMSRLVNFLSAEYNQKVPVLTNCSSKKVTCFVESKPELFLSECASLTGLEETDSGYSMPVDIVEILPSYGLGKDWTKVFPESVKFIGDSLVITGKREKVEEIKKAIKIVSTGDGVKVRVIGVFADEKTASGLGFKLTSWVKLNYAWTDIEREMYSFVAELKELEDRSINFSLNTEAVLIAGRPVETFLGSTERKEIFTVNSETGERLASNYINIDTGCKLTLNSFRAGDSHIVNVKLLDEGSKSDSVNSKLEYKSSVTLSTAVTEVLNVHREVDDSTKSSVLGLHRIPLLGTVFEKGNVSNMVFRVYIVKLSGHAG